MRPRTLLSLSLAAIVSGPHQLGVAEPLPGSSASVEADLDGDGRPERIRLDPSRSLALEVRRGRRVVWRGVPRRWRPWKLLAADLDGDGRAEILVGVHKRTRFFPEPHNALFVYGWEDGRVAPRWLGSSLSRPFSDLACVDLDGDRAAELLSLEVAPGGRPCIAIYAWTGFGFAGDRLLCAHRTARIVATRAGEAVVELDRVQRRIGR